MRTNDDELINDLVESLKNQNQILTDQLNKKSRTILGIAEMWSAFWNTIGGIWKDFWTAISTMWSNVWGSDSSIFGFVIVSIVFIVASSFTSCEIAKTLTPPPPAKIRLPELSTGNYKIETNPNHNKCYFIYEELTNGGKNYVTPCIIEREKALSALKEISETVNKDKKNENR